MPINQPDKNKSKLAKDNKPRKSKANSKFPSAAAHKTNAIESSSVPNESNICSIEAEVSILASMIVYSSTIGSVNWILSAEDFYKELHQKIYKVLIDFRPKEQINISTVVEELCKREGLQAVECEAYLQELIKACPTTINITRYAKVISEKSALRQLQATAEQIVNSTRSDVDNVAQLIELSKQKIFTTKLPWTDAAREMVHIKPSMIEAYDQIEPQFQGKGEATGTSTGFIDLDDITSGLQPSDLIIVASAASMGKSALCLNIAHHVALHEKMPVAIFSLEMSKEQLVQRLICSEAMINSCDLRRGFLQDSDWHRITNAVNNLYQAQIFIDDLPSASILEISTKARWLALEHGQLGLIVVDYLQLVKGVDKTGNRVQEISEIVRSLKALARELKVPVIALSQLSRALEQREDKRPILSDLRDSGSIGEDADIVMFVYRPSYYKIRKFNRVDYIPYEPDPDEGIAEVIIGKQRNGPVGTIRLGFQPEFARFTNLLRDPRDEYE